MPERVLFQARSMLAELPSNFLCTSATLTNDLAEEPSMGSKTVRPSFRWRRHKLGTFLRVIGSSNSSSALLPAKARAERLLRVLDAAFEVDALLLA